MNIRPASVIIILVNALSFMTMQVLFFWFVVSESIRDIVIDKSKLFKKIGEGIPEIDQLIKDYINSSQFEQDYNQAEFDYNLRKEHNIQLLWTWMTPPFSVIIILLGLTVIVELYHMFRNNRPEYRFDKTDASLLMFVFAAFLTELIFYFTVIYRSRTISDMDIFAVFIKNSDIDIREILIKILLSNLQPQLPPLPSLPPLPPIP